MNEPEPPDLERTLPARPSPPSNQDELESADLERTMPARNPGSSDEPESADLEKTFVPPGSSRPPSPPTPPPVPHSVTLPERPPDPLVPPASQSPPLIVPTLPEPTSKTRLTFWIITGCVICGLLAVFVPIVVILAVYKWTEHGERSLPPPTGVEERTAAPSERPAFLAKPGFIVGKAQLADGRPIPSFRVAAIAADGSTSAFVRDTAGPSIAEVDGRDGRYELRVGNSARTIALHAIAQIPYRGRTYRLEMHPTDADAAPFSAVTSHSDGTQPVTRDFVLKISGVRPGYDGRVVKETTSQDKPANAFYGGTVHLDLTYSEGAAYGEELARTPPDAKLAITLTPAGPLLDGSAGRPIVREIRPAAGQPNFYFHLHNIPLGVYAATARRIEPNGDAIPLRVNSTPRGYQPSAPVDFVPARTARNSGVESVTLFVVK